MARLRSKTYKDVILRDPCVYCHKNHEAARITVDHIQPRSRGGDNHWFNYAPACARCNRIKGNTTLLEFMLRDKGKVKPDEMMLTYNASLDPELVAELQADSGEYKNRWPLYALLGVDHRKPFNGQPPV